MTLVKNILTGVFFLSSLNAAAAGAGNTGGGCYNLQVIAVKDKSASLTDSNRHTIFIPLNRSTKIKLAEGDYKVIDGNGTDGEAKFSLPNPDPTGTGQLAYRVWARMVGKPDSTMSITSCAYDYLGELFCSDASNVLSMSRIAGTSKFMDASKQLLTVVADIDGDGDLDTVPLFNDALQDYFWDVDSTGRAHAQLRFCPL